MKTLWFANKAIPGFDKRLWTDLALQLDAGAFQMTLTGRYAIAVSTDNHGGVCKASSLAPGAEHLTSLALHFRFFTANVRDHIIQNVIRRNAWIACTRNRLHG